ncbi:hypothetical protein L1987_57421 [Smallanthus sonchifolius]|uniref:Uncharacterized protein n=1 Tax=Smallanthus sonchifolius TaxID=185202 RepID=A0ACB9DDG0_9ASTR|nr:hypothetical protein L1987_57421 [Smallanthus sonchifolius]
MSPFINICLSHFTLVTIFISTIPLLPLSASPHRRPFNKVYVFGDSYTDTGNTNDSTGPNIFRQVSRLPYGRTFFHRPTNRYSDGRLVIDFVAESLNLPYFPPYLNKKADTTHGVNFAVGGCTAIPYSFFKKMNSKQDTVPQSLTTQLTWFKKHIKGSGCNDAVSTPAACKAVFAGALVWIGEISANDYTYVFGTNVTSKTIQKLAIMYQTKFIEELLRMGAKYVVVQGLPATGCFPLSFALGARPTDRDKMGCVASKNKESYDHNMVLQEKLGRLRKEFPSTVIVYGDDWHAYREVYGNPVKYGFVERFKTCCGIGGGKYNFNPRGTCGAPRTSSCKHPSRYMSWDGLHVTEGLSRVVSKLFLDGAFAQPPFTYLLKKVAESTI